MAEDKPKRKVPKNPFSAAGAAAELQKRKGKVAQAIGDLDSKKKPKKKRPTRKKGATTYEEAKRTKHTGSEGEVSYGQRMGGVGVAQKARFKNRAQE